MSVTLFFNHLWIPVEFHNFFLDRKTVRREELHIVAFDRNDFTIFKINEFFSVLNKSLNVRSHEAFVRAQAYNQWWTVFESHQTIWFLIPHHNDRESAADFIQGSFNRFEKIFCVFDFVGDQVGHQLRICI
ncbi:hypothetical protein D3C87_1783310 [compost metagenome]